MKITSAVLVGLGGTGSHLVEPLARLLTYHRNGIRGHSHGLMLVDGDKYETKNGERQLGAVDGANKAALHCARLKSTVDGATFFAVPSYVDRGTFESLILGGIPGVKDGTLAVVLAVDNHATRKAILEALHAANLPRLLVLSPGNDLQHGQVLVWARHDGVDLTPYPLSRTPLGDPLYPELASPSDRIPGGCAALAPSTPQLLMANAYASTVCLGLVTAWLDDRPLPSRVEFGNPDRFSLRIRETGTRDEMVDLAKLVRREEVAA